MAVHFDQFGRANGWMTREKHCLMLGGMILGVNLFLIILDLAFISRSPFAVPVMPWIGVFITSMMVSVHIGIIIFALGGRFNIGLFMLGTVVGGYLLLWGVVFFRRAARMDRPGTTPLFSAPCKGPIWMELLILIARPIMPTRVELHNKGLRVLGDLYDLRYPYEKIESCEPIGSLGAFASLSAVKLALDPKSAVALKLKGNRMAITLSVGDRERFLAIMNEQLSAVRKPHVSA